MTRRLSGVIDIAKDGMRSLYKDCDICRHINFCKKNKAARSVLQDAWGMPRHWAGSPQGSGSPRISFLTVFTIDLLRFEIHFIISVLVLGRLHFGFTVDHGLTNFCGRNPIYQRKKAWDFVFLLFYFFGHPAPPLLWLKKWIYISFHNVHPSKNEANAQKTSKIRRSQGRIPTDPQKIRKERKFLLKLVILDYDRCTLYKCLPLIFAINVSFGLR